MLTHVTSISGNVGIWLERSLGHVGWCWVILGHVGCYVESYWVHILGAMLGQLGAMLDATLGGAGWCEGAVASG